MQRCKSPDNWLVMRCKPHKERIVSQQLKANGFRVFCPWFKVNPVNPRAFRQKPFYPGYLFLQQANEDADLKRIQWLAGSIGLVAFGGDPAQVPGSMIRAIRAKLADFQPDRTAFAQGQRVRVTEGLFAGYEGVFDAQVSGEQRSRVLLKLLQAQHKMVELPAEALTPTNQR